MLRAEACGVDMAAVAPVANADAADAMDALAHVTDADPAEVTLALPTPQQHPLTSQVTVNHNDLYIICTVRNSTHDQAHRAWEPQGGVD